MTTPLIAPQTDTTEPLQHDDFAFPSAQTKAALGVKQELSVHPLLTRKMLIPLAIVLFILNIPFFHLWLRGDAKTTTTVPFSDEYERAELGSNYFATGGFWRIVNGSIYSPGVKNNPLWLRAKLPRDVVVEFDVTATSDAGDVKCEIFGDGRNHSSGYILIFGGWKNTISAIARLNEHGGDRREKRDFKVEKNKKYHFKVERKGSLLTWYIDGAKFLDFSDPAPLEGSGHDRFAFGTWTSDGIFDNLTVRPF